MKKFTKVWISILGLLGVGLTYLASTTGLINQGFELYNNLSTPSEEETEYKNEMKLAQANYIGKSLGYIKSKLGEPIYINTNKNETEMVFSFKYFYIQNILDENEHVKQYTVTSKSEDFHPVVPYINIALGYPYKDYGELQYYVSGMSSKLFYYIEGEYLAFPGNYNYLFLSYNQSGVDYMDNGLIGGFYADYNEPPPKDEIIDFRINSAPNSFTISTENFELESKFGLGINYFESLNIRE